MRLSGLVFLVLLAGCSNPSMGPKAPLDLQFVLAPGESTDVQDAGIRLRFEGVSGDELTIALVQLTPYPFVSRPIAANDYRATLRVTR